MEADSYLIDLSGYNTVTNYSNVRSMNSGGWSKATQSSGYRNPLFNSQTSGMSLAGMKVGAYHFPDPTVTVRDNVSHFIDVAHSWLLDGDLAPLLDVENDPTDGIVWNVNNANAFVPAFIAELRRQRGRSDFPVIVYGSDSWWNVTLKPEQWGDLSNVFLMVANYNGVPGKTSFKHKRLAVHQYTDKAPTPGVTKPTDRSVIFNGFTLNDLLIGASKPTKKKVDDDMIEYLADIETGDKTSGFTRCAEVLGDGTINGVSWDTIKSKSAEYGGDGTGTVQGLSKEQFDDFERMSNLKKAAYQATIDTADALKALVSHFSSADSTTQKG